MSLIYPETFPWHLLSYPSDIIGLHLLLIFDHCSELFHPLLPLSLLRFPAVLML